jgi:hypothetical protein
VLTAVGLSAQDAQVQVGSPVTTVWTGPVVGGLPTTGLTTTLTVDHDGVLSADGWLGTPTEGADYPLVTAAQALRSLALMMHPMVTGGAEPAIAVACPARPTPTGTATARPTPVGTAPASTAPATTSPAIPSPVGSTPASKAPDDTGPVGTGPVGVVAGPLCGGPVEITGARLGLALRYDDSAVVLVPAWLFSASGQYRSGQPSYPIDVIAVQPRYLGTPTPPPATTVPEQTAPSSSGPASTGPSSGGAQSVPGQPSYILPTPGQPAGHGVGPG